MLPLSLRSASALKFMYKKIPGFMRYTLDFTAYLYLQGRSEVKSF